MLLFLFIISLYAIYELYWKRRRLPPGPAPWLFLGNLPNVLVHSTTDDMFLYWKQTYGNIVTFWIGPIPLIMVCDVDTMKRYFVQRANVFSNRWRNHVTDSFMGGAYGIIQVDGDKWREQRRFALTVLRDFGIGRAFIEDKIQNEIDLLINHLLINCDKAVDLCEMTGVCVGNIINSILFGKHFEQGDKEFHNMHRDIDEQFRLVVHPIMALYIALPFMTRIPFINIKWKQLMVLRNRIWGFIKRNVEEHKTKFDPSVSPADFIFAYLKEMEKREMENIPSYFSEWQLSMVLLDLLFAGMETTATTLKWGFLFVILNPDVQNKVRDELDQFPTKINLIHRNQCPYTNATINEIQRLANIIPINLLRTVAEDVSMDTYFYPKNTLCIPQISVVMNDPMNFENPKEFRPERFLENGKLSKCEELIPFSLGKRQCVGESLAKAELFLIFANVLRNFILKQDPSTSLSSERVLGLTVSPPRYRITVELRQKAQ